MFAGFGQVVRGTVVFDNLSNATVFSTGGELSNTTVPLTTCVTKAEPRAKIDFTYNGKQYRYTDDLIVPTDHLVAEEIETRKINASLAEKLRMAEKLLNAGTDYKKAMLYPFPLLNKTIDKIAKDVNTAPADSSISFHPCRKPMFSVTRERVGYELDEEILYRDAYMHLKRGAKQPLGVRPKILNPKVVSFDNMKLTRLRSRFVTSYAHSNDDRKHNIALALSKINGSVIEPDAEFSFNKTVGRRKQERGFRVAKIIMDGVYVNGVGGGVCQASTTLYNAALLADMAITQCKNHSLAPVYVPPSFDAMVNASSSDLKFKNTGDTTVFIRAYGDGTHAAVEFYGAELPYKISTHSVTVYQSSPPPDKEEIDHDYQYFNPNAYPGSRMRIANGYGALKSEGYLIYHDLSGRFLERKLIRKDSYQALAGTVAVAP